MRERGGSGVATGPAAPGSGLLRLVLDLPGAELAYAAEHVLAAEGGDAAAAGIVQAMLTQPDRGYDGPVVFVTTAPAGAAYGIGADNPASRPVDVNGLPGRLFDMTSLIKSLGWHQPDGRAVHLVGARVTDDDLLAAARSMRVDPDGRPGWTSPPVRGLVLTSPSVRTTGPRRSAEVRYELATGRVSLRVQEGGEAVLMELVRDRAASAAELRAAEVDGVAAVMTRYADQDRWALLWEVRPGVVAELVVSDLAPGMDVLDVAGAIREASAAQWEAVLDRGAAVAGAGAGSRGASPDQAAATVEALCRLRGEWLAADTGGRAEGEGLLRNLRRHAVEVGLDRNTDLVAVLDRLLAAMAAGDAARVRSIPEGGACG